MEKEGKRGRGIRFMARYSKKDIKTEVLGLVGKFYGCLLGWSDWLLEVTEKTRQLGTGQVSVYL